jgi:hypothetical protein
LTKGIFEPMRQLERVAEFEPRNGTVVGQPLGEPTHLRFDTTRLAGHGELADEQAALGDVTGRVPQVRVEKRDGLALVPFLGEQRRLLSRGRASGAREDRRRDELRDDEADMTRAQRLTGAARRRRHSRMAEYQSPDRAILDQRTAKTPTEFRGR